MATPISEGSYPETMEIKVNELVLEKVKVMASMTLTGQLLQDLVLSKRNTLEDLVGEFSGNMVYELSSYVMAEETNKIHRSFSYPDGWWQMFKERFFNHWLKTKFPIKMKKKSWTVRVMATYPKLPQVFKDQRPVFRYLVNEDTNY
jgi:hypothetical protein